MSNLGQFLSSDLARLVYFSGEAFDPAEPKNLSGGKDSPLRIHHEIFKFLEQEMRAESHPAKLAKARMQRLARMVVATGGEVLRFEAIDRSLSGIGIPTPLENGIHLDWTTGWPVVPGSGLKGVTRSWVGNHARSLEDLNVASREDLVDLHIAVFGCGPDDGDDGAAGGVIFHDGWYGADGHAPIVFDVMTPHYGDFQKGEARQRDGTMRVTPPADWSEPNPISFLAIEAGAQLQVAIAGRTAIDADLVPVAAHWLERALAEAGLGAKTTEGFGRFKRVLDRDA